jgi:PhnB protein
MAKKTKKGSKPVKPTAKPVKAARGAAAKRAKQRAPAKKAVARPRKPSPVPAGIHTVTPSLVVSGCAKAIDFYKQAFGAKELMRMMMPGGDQVMHAEVRIGDSVIYMNDPMMKVPAPSTQNPSTTSIWLYVPNCDAMFDQAVKAGATVGMPMADMFWGDRCGMLLDPFGIPWWIATHARDVSMEEMRKAGEEFARQMASQAGGPGSQTPEGAASQGVPSAGEPPQAQGAST